MKHIKEKWDTNMYVVICIMGVLIELKISIILYRDKCEMYVCIHLNYEPMKH